MNKNEIKKALYRERPRAEYKGLKKQGLLYECELKNGTKIKFLIPDIEARGFYSFMPAQLLIRWLEI